MPGRIEKTVFISYRRTNLPWAVLIYQDLTRHGYDVFLDYKNIRSGDFEQIIIQNIKGRAHFVVILTPSALEKCNEPGDWLRREIELAIEEKRNIVPVMLEGFNFSSPSISKYLTGKLAVVKKYNGLTVPAEYIEAAMVRLRNEFLSVPLNAVLQPISDAVQKAVIREQPSFEKVRPLLEENERILYEGSASHAAGGKKVGGHLYLTNQRLIFRSNIFNVNALEWHIFLEDVLEVTPSLALGFVPNEISVKTKDGVDKFIVFERNKWLKLIQDARKE
jgi:hypothetical protein